MKNPFKTKKIKDDLSDTTKISLSALLIAVFFVNNRFLAVRLPFATVSLAIITVMFAAFVMGWRWAAVVAGVSEMLAALLVPVGGSWWPEVTLGWIFAGIIFGLFLHRSRNKSDIVLLMNLVISSLIVYVGVHLFYMSAVFYGRTSMPFWGFWGYRAAPFFAMMCIQIAISFPLFKFLRDPIDRFLVLDDDFDNENIAEESA